MVWGYHSLLNHPPTIGHLGCFQLFLAVANETATDNRVQVFMWTKSSFLWINAQKYDYWVVCSIGLVLKETARLSHFYYAVLFFFFFANIGIGGLEIT